MNLLHLIKELKIIAILQSEQITEWLENGIVKSCISDFANVIVVIKKKVGFCYVCMYHCILNFEVIKDRYPLPT